MSLIFNGVENNKVIWNGAETKGILNGNVLWGVEEEPEEVTIGTQTWKRFNLAINDGGDGIVEKDVTYNGVNLGKQYYYSRAAAIRIANTINGWHVPSYSEWNTLRSYAGGNSTCGAKLKANFAWKQGGNDEYNFRLLPTGWWDNSTSTLNLDGTYNRWMSTSYDYGVYLMNFPDDADSSVWNECYTYIYAPVRLIKG